jgi:hypothetical protein
VVAPSGWSVLLGNAVTFAATVSNTPNTEVTWSVSDMPGGSAAQGTISPQGVFTAPPILPSPATVLIQAASVADSTKIATATVTILSDISMTLSPASAAVELGAQQTFQASVASAGRPSSAVLWTLSGPGCSGFTCGTVSADGASLRRKSCLTVERDHYRDERGRSLQNVAVTFTVASNPTNRASGRLHRRRRQL